MWEENEEYTVDAAFKQIQKNVINLLIWRVEVKIIETLGLSGREYAAMHM